MKMSKIGSANTYVRCLKELHLWNYIRYEPSFNRHKGSLVYLYTFDNRCDNASVMPVSPSINNINIVNNENLLGQAQNFELNNSDMNEEKKEKSSGKKERKAETGNESPETPGLHEKKTTDEANPAGSFPPSLEYVKIYFDEKGVSTLEAEKFFNYFESNGWLVGGRAKMKDWKAAARNWILNIPKFASKPKPSGSKQTNLSSSKNYGEPL